MRCDKKQPSNLGSSETTREAPLFKKSQFDFSLYFKTLSQTIKITDVKFLQWFIGFSEGDGSFIISKTIVALL
jgi:hypothetical protein